MIHHVVIWTLKNPAEIGRFKALLESCAGLVPGMLRFEVGSREAPLPAGLEATGDVVLVSSFESVEALQAYQTHPHHKVVGAELGPMRQGKQVLDWVA